MNISPRATYRLQMNFHFTIQQATDLVDYLNELGVSHCYSSPLLKAKANSTHGYDVVDQSKLNPEIGTLEELENWTEHLHKQAMGLILDIVPNHMCISDSWNVWWQDVLENGPASPYAGYFDIDWHPLRAIFDNKILLPLLDQQYGACLENQTIQLIYQAGTFRISLHAITLPTDPKSWGQILKSIAKNIPEGSSENIELKSICTAIAHLPATTVVEKEILQERMREKEVIKKRLESLFSNEVLLKLLQTQIALLNGIKGNPRSFDALDTFLNAQPYRLCFWRIANFEINFRRFFDIIEYVGIRTEKLEVFDATHKFIIELCKKNLLDGLRIDHIDGLWDPEQYLLDLQTTCAKDPPIYVVAEKILTGNEKLRPEWSLQGTVGYEYLNQLNGIFVYQENKKLILDTYRNFTGITETVLNIVYECKMLVLNNSLSSELYVLARRLDHIAESHRSSQDFTVDNLRTGLSSVIACFPVYRSYIQASKGIIHDEDRAYILAAVNRAKRKNSSINSAIFQFIQSVLLLESPDGLEESFKADRVEFVMHFQQLTGPVMAKGLEDTAFYQFYPLVSLNEVGSDPYSFGISLEQFHKFNSDRLEHWPHSMLASTTHDTKRSEDVRARINILSEIPEEWNKAILAWHQMNLIHKTAVLDDEAIPDNNEAYLLYQTLLGTWPLFEMDSVAHERYVARIKAYMEKASKEAKIHNSWVNPNEEYDQAMQKFIEKILDPQSENAFLHSFKQFHSKIAFCGMQNSLSQTLIKLTSPGIPDIYQGNEIWDFSMVDPDSRRPVDYVLRKKLLENLQLEAALSAPEDGRIKLFITQKTLQLRREMPDVFSKGKYIPLSVKGPMQEHVVAFARVYGNSCAIVVARRFFSFFMKSFLEVVDEQVWKETLVNLPEDVVNNRFENVYTGKVIEPNPNGLSLGVVMGPLQQALLIKI